jgi:hypothetical protein
VCSSGQCPGLVDPGVYAPICFGSFEFLVRAGPEFLNGAREEGVEPGDCRHDGLMPILHRPRPPDPQGESWPKMVNRPLTRMSGEPRDTKVIEEGKAAGTATRFPSRRVAALAPRLECAAALQGALLWSLPVRAACRFPVKERSRTTVAWQHDHDRADLYPAVEIDHILIGHANAARGNRTSDVFGLVGAMDAIQRVLAAGVKVQGA